MTRPRIQNDCRDTRPLQDAWRAIEPARDADRGLTGPLNGRDFFVRRLSAQADDRDPQITA